MWLAIFRTLVIDKMYESSVWARSPSTNIDEFVVPSTMITIMRIPENSLVISSRMLHLVVAIDVSIARSLLSSLTCRYGGMNDSTMSNCIGAAYDRARSRAGGQGINR